MGLSGEHIMAIVSMLVLLVFWIMVLRNEREGNRWLNQALLRRQEKLDAERNKDRPATDDKSDKEPTGPWG